jgi:hypothetical protein
MRSSSWLLVVILVSLGTIPIASASTVSVPGSSNPWLAGMPDGSTAKSDTAPAQSPVEVLGLTLVAGQALSFSATGTTNHGNCLGASPDAGNCGGGFSEDANGMSGITTFWDSLIGVFLSDDQPDAFSPPADLDFTGNTSFTSLSPELRQVFFIGDGLTGTGSGSVQQFVVPTGATRLFLGSADGFGWYNNTGEFIVTVTAPEPVPGLGSVAITLLGTLLGATAYWRLRSSPSLV